MLSVSVIIINYNTLELTLQCIDSIYKFTKDINFEVIVVDNGSVICPISKIKTKFNDVIVIKSSINLGFGKANNLGSSYANGKYLLFLNSDTLLLNNAIKIMFDFIEQSANYKVAAVGANLYTVNGEPNFSYSIHFPTLSRIILYRLRFFKFFKEEVFNFTNLPKKVKIIIGADLLINKDIFNKIGQFDPFYFMYIEDGDLQFQLHKNDYIVFSLPEAKIVHMQGSSSTTGAKMIMEVDSYYYFFKKNFGLLKSILYITFEILLALVFLILFSFTFRKSKIRNYFRLLIHLINEYIYSKIIS